MTNIKRVQTPIQTEVTPSGDVSTLGLFQQLQVNAMQSSPVLVHTNRVDVGLKIEDFTKTMEESGYRVLVDIASGQYDNDPKQAWWSAAAPALRPG